MREAVATNVRVDVAPQAICYIKAVVIGKYKQMKDANKLICIFTYTHLHIFYVGNG